MKIKSLKKVIASLICAALVFISAPQMSASAALKDIQRLGGRYDELVRQNYDHNAYQCHHLIAKEALNQWGDDIYENGGINQFNEFLVGDEKQNWGPSIIMEKADHEQTLSYYNSETRTRLQNSQASKYISKQAYRIINYGNIKSVLRYEIDFIKRTFPGKYDVGISQVWAYIESLQFSQIKNRTTLTMRNPYNLRWFFNYQFKR